MIKLCVANKHHQNAIDNNQTLFYLLQIAFAEYCHAHCPFSLVYEWYCCFVYLFIIATALFASL